MRFAYSPSSPSFRSADRSKRSKELDRASWAFEGREVVVWETEGTGSILTPPIPFKRRFEGQPAFSYGVEAGPGAVLVSGDYPFLSAGVAEWGIFQVNEGRASFYNSARVWITVASTAVYLLRWTFTFSGTAMRINEHLGGG